MENIKEGKEEGEKSDLLRLEVRKRTKEKERIKEVEEGEQKTNMKTQYKKMEKNNIIKLIKEKG